MIADAVESGLINCGIVESSMRDARASIKIPATWTRRVRRQAILA